ncbi:nicotinate-nucleotide adenylyltransferase [Clostridium sp.]|uniref:nicotinate-nucleotide adenylyltransferase n=1 Tax=Clostridium sp. TaxID=1506 RepID=UPI002FC8A65C
MMKKAIFGGTFDPIHVGHMHIAYEALYNLNLDKVIFMPNGNPPHKVNKVKTSADIRYEMVNMAIKGESMFQISDYEVNSRSLSYTYKTLQHFNAIEPETEWYFLTGVDSLMDLNKWKNIDIILENCTLIVFSRPGYTAEEIFKMKETIEKTYKREIIYLHMPVIDVSSTAIKEKIRLNRQVSYLLPCGIEEVIKKYILYK